jgi:hypothetical protein
VISEDLPFNGTESCPIQNLKVLDFCFVPCDSCPPGKCGVRVCPFFFASRKKLVPEGRTTDVPSFPLVGIYGSNIHFL